MYAKLLFAAGAAATTAIQVAAEAPTSKEWAFIDVTVAYVGVPFNVLIMAAIGSIIAVMRNRVSDPRTLIVSFLYSTLFALGASVGIAEFTGYQWSSTGAQAIFTAILGFTAQNWGPVLLDNIAPAVDLWLKRQIKRIFNISIEDKKHDDSQ